MSKLSSLGLRDDHARWLAPGASYRKRTVSHDDAYQEVRLKAAGVDPALYGDMAETGLFGLDCFDSMVDAGLDIDGYVFLGQRYRLIRQPALGETLEIDGHVRDLGPTARGPVVVESYRFTDSQGHVCVESELTGLLSLPDGGVDESAPALPRRPAQPTDGWLMIQEKQITPDDVRIFSQDVGNEVHFDVEFARKLGFRAPIAQGIMSAVWLMSGLCGQGPMPVRFLVDVRYLRPVFWDDYASLWLRRDEAGAIVMAQSRNAEGKVTADMNVVSMAAQPNDGGD